MILLKVFVGVLLLLVEVKSFYLKKENIKEDQLLHSWDNFRKSIGLPEKISSSQIDDVSKPQVFNELEALMLIPTIVELWKKDLLLESEKRILSEIYGNIWTIMSEEVHRDKASSINPLLKTIYDLRSFLSSTVSYQMDNPIGLSLKDEPNPLSIEKLETDPPSQRLLNLAAVLIKSMKLFRRKYENQRQSSDEIKSEERIGVFRSRRVRSAASTTKTHKSVSLPNPPRTKRKTSKPHRSCDLPHERIAAALQKLVEQKGAFQDQNYEDPSMDSDYFDVAENNDYSYDDHFEYDDRANRGPSRQFNFENGSFQDLLMLAARHSSASRIISRRRN